MELPISLEEPVLGISAFIPALRTFSEFVEGERDGEWKLKINQDKLRSLRLSIESIIRLLTSLNIEIISSTPREVIVQLPSDTTLDLEDYLESRLDAFLVEYKPRALTSQEIDDILNSLPQVFSPIQEISDYTLAEIKKRVRIQLKEIRITPLGIPDLKEQIVRRFEQARVEPGSTVGLTVAEALSALTQGSLNAFHFSGARSNASSGNEMLKELLNVSQDRKSEVCSIHFWDKDMSFEDVFHKRISIDAISVGDLVIDYDILPTGELEPYWWLTTFPLLTGKSLPRTSTVVLLTLNKDLMYAHEISMSNVTKAIQEYNTPETVVCVPGPLDSGLMIVFPIENLIVAPLEAANIPTIENMAGTFISDIFLPSLPNLHIKGIRGIKDISILATLTWGMVDDIVRLKTKRNWRIFLSTFRMTENGITANKVAELLTVLEYKVNAVREDSIDVVAPNADKPSVYVMDKITKAENAMDEYLVKKVKIQRERRKALLQGKEVIPELPPEPSEEMQRIYRVSRYHSAISNGSNLVELMKRPDIDTTRTISNNPQVVLRILGIEATRNLLIHEFNYILENANLNLDPRHITLLSDFMTIRGVLLPISFHGVVKQNPGALTLGSFGEPIDVFGKAAAFGSGEEIRTVASSMYVGTRSEIGTGYSQLKVDDKMIEEFRKGKEEVSGEEIENALAQLNEVTFGNEESGTGALGELASLNFVEEENVEETVKGENISPPPLLIAPTPLISKAVNRSLEDIQLAGAIEEATKELDITVVEEKEAPKARITPRRSRIAARGVGTKEGTEVGTEVGTGVGTKEGTEVGEAPKVRIRPRRIRPTAPSNIPKAKLGQ